ncbi:plasmid replication protein RepC [Paracoccus litorisediminis]|uniref:Replication initiation protein n=1 Tax=Paracoccus litorisediminis TaxID=2006130 RepID=A0A844HWB8_9RHOB|nr:plasmid replication protein RepC [Paracoccus litorisediminis]MTH61762.1 replication initiation protein [Paracoccus litorisediminis]
MGYVPITSFRRMIDAVQLQRHQMQTQPLPAQAVNKWDALRELATARTRYGLTDRDMTVLQALLSFYPGSNLDQPEKLVIHPSNDSICERLNGMPCSTMRRHLGNLVTAGVIGRRDSPNGKRYVRRSAMGATAYGFDLSPLIHRFAEFTTSAAAVRSAEQQVQELREAASLMRRDLYGLLELAQQSIGTLDRFRDLLSLTGRALRRKLTLPELDQISRDLEIALDQLRSSTCPPSTTPTESDEMSTNAAKTEQHYQRSDKEYLESEKSVENVTASRTENGIPLGLVLTTCPEIVAYCEHPILHWSDFVALAEKVRPMMGVCNATWAKAKRHMGRDTAAVVLAAMLQRFTSIRSPGAYLQTLSAKAALGAFSAGPMISALMNNPT